MPGHDALLRAVQLAARRLVSTGDIDALLRDVLRICVEAVGATGGTIYLHDPISKKLRFQHVLPEEVRSRLNIADISDDFGVAGRVFHSRQTEISHFQAGGDPSRKGIESQTGVVVRSMITVPLCLEDQEPVGVVQLINKQEPHTEFGEEDAIVLETVAAVCTLAISNSRLLEQMTRVASLEGMGRVAHDLANKAAVLVRYSPWMRQNIEAFQTHLNKTHGDPEAQAHLESIESIFGEAYEPASERIYRYAMLINDLAAGKPLLPQLKLGSFGAVIEEAGGYLEPVAKREHVGLVYQIQKDAPPALLDELYVGRIVENLLGNAVKATKEIIPATWLREHLVDEDALYSSVILSYCFSGENHVLEVRDEGPGMAPETIEKVLLGTARSRWEQSQGTGLGTKVVIELAQALEAKLMIQSELGQGTTFRVEFPHQIREIVNS